jgi:hypothetical protein
VLGFLKPVYAEGHPVIRCPHASFTVGNYLSAICLLGQPRSQVTKYRQLGYSVLKQFLANSCSILASNVHSRREQHDGSDRIETVWLDGVLQDRRVGIESAKDIFAFCQAIWSDQELRPAKCSCGRECIAQSAQLVSCSNAWHR